MQGLFTRVRSVAVLCAVAAAMHVTAAGAQNGTSDKCARLNNSGAFACSGRVISWITIRVEGELLKSRRAEYRTLVRRRLQKELAYLGHEQQRFVDAARAMKDRPIADISAYRAERGEVSCYIWTVGTEYPVPVYVECELFGWGVGLEMTNEFSARYLGAGPPEEIPALAENGIHHAIARIADQLLAQRQEWRRRGG